MLVYTQAIDAILGELNEAYSGGVFGNGLYFADCASKAGEYVREVLPSEICELGGERPLLAGHAAMFCSRVLLGRPYENVVKPSKNVKLNIAVNRCRWRPPKGTY